MDRGLWAVDGRGTQGDVTGLSTLRVDLVKIQFLSSGRKRHSKWNGVHEKRYCDHGREDALGSQEGHGLAGLPFCTSLRGS